MTWKEIEQRYKDEWVLVEVTQTDENHEVIEGNVLCHHSSEVIFRKKADQFEPEAFTIRYIGQPPPDLAVML